jgi:peroxiredoxin
MQAAAFGLEPLLPATRAESFSLKDIEGRNVSLSDYKDKAALLFFWTTWCPHCQGELRTVNDMKATLNKDNIEMFAINVGEASAKVVSFVKSRNFTFQVLLDTDTAVAKEYGVLGVPTFILINKNGKIVSQGHSFPRNYKNLSAE